MLTRPKAAPNLLATIAEKAPPRLVRKLDKEPRLADGWSWSTEGEITVVRTDKEETVTLKAQDGVILGVENVSCTCLLTPRCLHVLATLNALEIAELSVPKEEDKTISEAPGDTVERELIRLDDKQLAAARQIWSVGREILSNGAQATGTVLQAELLRASHSCQLAGLTRLFQSGLRTVNGIRSLREEKADFSLPRLASEMLELLETAWYLGSSDQRPEGIDLSLRGVARRAYSHVGGMRLYGLFTEPILSGTQDGGVVTYLCGKDQVCTISDVRPGGRGRARQVYSVGAAIRGSTISHQQLSREGLFLQGATESRDGRLGQGQSVHGVSAGPSSWDDEIPSGLWRVSLSDQLLRTFEASEIPPAERPAGSDLLFLSGTVLGTDGLSLVMAVPGDGDKAMVPVRCLATLEHAELGYHENLKLLACAPGLSLRFVGRVRFDEPRTLALLAIGLPSPGVAEGPLDGDPVSLMLPSSWGGRCNLGLDMLQRSFLKGALPQPALVPGQSGRSFERLDPLAPLRRRLHRLVLGGRSTLPPETLWSVENEAQKLQSLMMPAASHLLLALSRSAVTAERSTTGERRQADPEKLARAWVTASTYERAANQALRRLAWL